MRLLFARDQTDDYRAITTFELKSSDDLYWFNAAGALDLPATPVPGGSTKVDLTAPEGWETMEQVKTRQVDTVRGGVAVAQIDPVDRASGFRVAVEDGAARCGRDRR